MAGKRLLVVEDNATNQRIIAQRAGQWGMTVETAPDSREALYGLGQGAQIVRVHDVVETRQAIATWRALADAG